MIEIVDPKTEWPLEFSVISEALNIALGAAVVRIDHIGSTSVPGLVAKDIIDIQITVTDIGDESLPKLMESSGFTHRPQIVNDLLVGVSPDSPELKKLFFREPQGQRTANIHVREQNRLNQQYALLFRDYLRAHSDICDAYGRIKLELARKFPNDVDAYYDIKDPYIDTLFFAAREWAKHSGWPNKQEST